MKMSKLIEVDGNWKVFETANPTDSLILLHATSLRRAKQILKTGFTTDESNWIDSEEGYVYLGGSRYNLGTYLRYSENAIVKVAVRKECLLPDDKSVDWKEYVKLHRQELKKDRVNVRQPTAFDTFKHIGQVKARIEDVLVFDYMII